MFDEELKKLITWIARWVAVGVLILVMFLFGISWVSAQYTVWSEGMAGKAELAKADWNRQIAVREAKAKQESAVLLAKAEVERAKGVAQANKIIGASLQQNEAYLRYLWIDNLKNEKNQVIYIPTEAGLPILEAGRIKK